MLLQESTSTGWLGTEPDGVTNGDAREHERITRAVFAIESDCQDGPRGGLTIGSHAALPAISPLWALYPAMVT